MLGASAGVAQHPGHETSRRNTGHLTSNAVLRRYWIGQVNTTGHCTNSRQVGRLPAATEPKLSQLVSQLRPDAARPGTEERC